MAVGGSAPRHPSLALLLPSAAGYASVLPSTATTSPPPSTPLPLPPPVGREEALDPLLAASSPAPLPLRAAAASFPELPPRAATASFVVVARRPPTSLRRRIRPPCRRDGWIRPRARGSPRRRGGGRAPPPLPRPSPLADAAAVEATATGGGGVVIEAGGSGEGREERCEKGERWRYREGREKG
uniref:Uncharacterized protein n=1 Tax=Oryza meridionalis TaxID=40149 RepID=A0A0E0F3T8_9ORYZ